MRETLEGQHRPCGIARPFEVDGHLDEPVVVLLGIEDCLSHTPGVVALLHRQVFRAPRLGIDADCRVFREVGGEIGGDGIDTEVAT